MSLFLGYGTSSGGLNTEGNLSDSSDAVFLQIIYHPSRFLDKNLVSG